MKRPAVHASVDKPRCSHTDSPISSMDGLGTSMDVLDNGFGSDVEVSGTSANLGFRGPRLLLLGCGSSVPVPTATGSASGAGGGVLRRLGGTASGSGSGVGVVTGVCSSCCTAVLLLRGAVLADSRFLRPTAPVRRLTESCPFDTSASCWRMSASRPPFFLSVLRPPRLLLLWPYVVIASRKSMRAFLCK